MATQDTKNVLFSIPKSIRGAALPYTEPISSLLQFNFPAFVSSLKALPEMFLSDATPTAESIQAIQAVPVLPMALISQIIDSMDESSLAVVCPHAPRANRLVFPAWILTYWKEVRRIYEDHAKPWKEVLEKLENRKRVSMLKGHTRAVQKLDGAYAELAKLPWDATIQGIEDSKVPILSLSTYLTTKWLNDENINQMLTVLRTSLQSTEVGSDTIVASLGFMLRLKNAHRDCQQEGSNSIYEAQRSNKVLRDAMEELTSGRKRYFATIQHVNGNHWVPIVLDFETRSLHYGDSLRMTPDADLMATLDWWTVAHTGQQFEAAKLLTTHQTDNFSCGLLSFNAIGHFLSEDQFPLLRNDAATLYAARIDMLQEILEIHGNGVSRLCTSRNDDHYSQVERIDSLHSET